MKLLPARCSQCGQRDLIAPLGCAMGGGFLFGGFLFGVLGASYPWDIALTLAGFIVGWVIGVNGRHC